MCISVNCGWNEKWLERKKTHEVSVIKAIGARNRDILTIFLLESGIISVIGGILGIFIRAIGANVISVGLESAFGVEIPAILHAEVCMLKSCLAVLQSQSSSAFSQAFIPQGKRRK